MKSLTCVLMLGASTQAIDQKTNHDLEEDDFSGLQVSEELVSEEQLGQLEATGAPIQALSLKKVTFPVKGAPQVKGKAKPIQAKGAQSAATKADKPGSAKAAKPAATKATTPPKAKSVSAPKTVTLKKALKWSPSLAQAKKKAVPASNKSKSVPKTAPVALASKLAPTKPKSLAAKKTDAKKQTPPKKPIAKKVTPPKKASVAKPIAKSAVKQKAKTIKGKGKTHANDKSLLFQEEVMKVESLEKQATEIKTQSQSLVQSIAQAEAEIEALTLEASNANQQIQLTESGRGQGDGFDDSQAVMEHQQLMEATQAKIIEKKKRISLLKEQQRKLEEQAHKDKLTKKNKQKAQLKTQTVLAASLAEQQEIQQNHNNLAQDEPMSLEDQEEASQAKINEENDKKLAKNEEALKDAISDEEQHKADLDQAHRDHSSEEMQPTIKKSESERDKVEKKREEFYKKEGKENTKTQIKEAKEVDKQMKQEFKNVAAHASLKAFEKPKASLAQKSKNKKIIKLQKTVQKLTQKQDEMSLEDQEEQAQAKINEANDAKLAKNEEALKDAISAKEKHKVALDKAHREHSSEELEPTIAKANEDRAKAEEKEEKKMVKIGKQNTKTQIKEAKDQDKKIKKEFKNEYAAAAVKASKASLVQKTKAKKVIKLQKEKPQQLNQAEDISVADQEEAEQAIVNAENAAKLQKNEEALSNGIKANEKRKADNHTEHIEASNSEMIPTIIEAEKKLEEVEKKREEYFKKEGEKSSKKQIEEAKKQDAEIKKITDASKPKKGGDVKKVEAKSLAQEEPMSKEDQEEQASAKINEANDAKLAKNEDALKDAITVEEQHKADLDAAHRDGSSEELQPTIKKAESERSKAEKKEAKDLKKLGDDNSKLLTDEAKAADKKLAADFKAAQPPPLKGPASTEASLVQKTKAFDTALTKSGFDQKAKKAAPVLKKLSVAEITKMVIEKAKKLKLSQEEPSAISKEDQEEAAQAKINEANDAELAKNEETLKNAITSNEKHKADLDAAHRDHSSEELQPTIKKAESERKKDDKKVAADLKKLGVDFNKKLIGEAKAIDESVNKEFKFESAKASLKVFPKDSLAQAEPEESKADQEEAAQAIINAKNEAELAKNEKALADGIIANEKKKADTSEGHIEGSSIGVGEVLKKANEDNESAIKKQEGDLKKEGEKITKDLIKVAKAVDKKVNKEYPNVAVKASIKAFDQEAFSKTETPAKASLAQAEPEMSLEDEEEAAQAVINAREEKELAKKQKALADQIKADEDHKAALDAAHREQSSEELQPTIKKAESEQAKFVKKQTEDQKKEGKKRMDEQIKMGADEDKALDKRFPNKAAKASLKAFPPAALAQVDVEAKNKAKELEKALADKQKSLEASIEENQQLKAKLDKAEKAQKAEKIKKSQQKKDKRDNNSLQVEDMNIDGKVNVQDLIAKAVKNANSKKNGDIFTLEAPKEDDKTSNQEIMSLAEKADQKQGEIMLKESEEAQNKEEEQTKKDMQEREIKFKIEKDDLEKQKEERAAEQKKQLAELQSKMSKMRTKFSKSQKSSKSLEDDGDFEELEGDDISSKKLHQMEFKEKILPKSFVQINIQHDKYLKSRIKDVDNLLVGLKQKYQK